MLLLCSIKRGSQVRKRGRRQWLSILEKQPGLVTSRDQVQKQMGSDLLAVLLRPHVPLRILGVDSLTPLYPKLQLITMFPTELVFMKQPCLSLVNIIKEGWVPSFTWRIFISWRIAMMNGNPSWLLSFPGAPVWLVGDRSRHTWRSPDGQMGTYLNAHLKPYFPVVIWRRKGRRTTRTALAQLALNTFLPGPALSFSQKRKVVRGCKGPALDVARREGCNCEMLFSFYYSLTSSFLFISAQIPWVQQKSPTFENIFNSLVFLFLPLLTWRNSNSAEFNFLPIPIPDNFSG